MGMSQSPRLSEKTSQTTKGPVSAPMLVFMTALDTTWRAFVPTLGGTFAGIGLDNLFNIAPFGVIGCLVVGTVLSTVLIVRQLINVRKPLK
jgi:hypothetical protein